MKQTHKSLRTNQSGMAAIMIVLILMMVISITVIGFAKIIRREQQSALNDHLSTRAFYAAESGLNIAKNALNNPAVASAYAATPKTSCGTDTNITNLILDTSTQTEVSCLTINASQDELLYNVSQNHSQSVPLNANGTISSVTITWQSSTATGSEDYTSCSASNQTNNVAYGSAWANACPAPEIRIDLVPTNNLTRGNLTSQLFTAFLIPNSKGVSTATTGYGPATTGNGQGVKVSTVQCDTSRKPYACSVRIDNFLAGVSTAALRISAYYRDALVSVVTKDSIGKTLTLSGAQATIDSTGRAFDVVQRVQARVPLTNDFAFPDAGVQATAGLCKIYQVTPGVSPYVSQNGAPAAFGTADPCD